jgi:predicted amidohydrolase
MKIAVAQTNPILGDIQANLEKMLKIMKDYQDQADLIVFPELSLTGYILREQAYDVAIAKECKVMKEICDASKEYGVHVMFGFVEEGKGKRIFNSAAFVKNGQVSTIQRKIYPTNYGIFEEGKYFARGKRLYVDQLDSFDTTMLICNDMWHPSLPHIAAHYDTSLLVALINSPDGGLGPKYSSTSGWERVGKFYASVYGCYVILVNRVGQEESVRFYGNSKVIDPYGQVILECPFNDEVIQTCDIDIKSVEDVRRLLPIMRDEDVDFTIRHLTEISKLE